MITTATFAAKLGADRQAADVAEQNRQAADSCPNAFPFHAPSARGNRDAPSRLRAHRKEVPE